MTLTRQHTTRLLAETNLFAGVDAERELAGRLRNLTEAPHR